MPAMLAQTAVLPARVSGLAGSRVVPRAAAKPMLAKRAAKLVCNAGTTVEEQRKVAKELVKYFNDKAYEREYLASRTFGWTKNAEVTNSRWVMFGLLVGMMTEFATGVNFPGQIALTLTNLGFADIYE